MAIYSSEDSKSVLIVDDDRSVRSIIADALEFSGHYSTQEADNAMSALQMLKEESYDLIISDHRMPGMSGIDLLNRVKELNPAIPIIIMSGYPSIDLSVSAIKDGAVDFLSKPFKVKDLLFKVDLYLKEQSFQSLKDLESTDNSSLSLNKKIRTLSTISYLFDTIDKSDGDSDELFDEIVSMALRISGGDHGYLFLIDNVLETFHPRIIKNIGNSQNIDNDAIGKSLFPLLKKVADTCKPLLIATTSSELYDSLLCLPLMIRKRPFGLLVLIQTQEQKVFNETDLTYVLNLTSRASLNIENKMLYESLFGSIMETFKSLVQSIHARDQYTERHSISVKNLAIRTAETMNCSVREIESLRIAATLHDIGKIAIPDSILLKPGELTEEEYSTIKQHSVIGENILMSLALLETERKIIRHHHERWDGRGYPDGLSGNEIPRLSRILAVADTFDAMTSDRPYRKGLSSEDAFSELRRNVNTQFDRIPVDAFLETFKTV